MEHSPNSLPVDSDSSAIHRRIGTSLRLTKLSAGFGSTSVLKIDQLDIAAGEFTSIVGPSGCGKSTLLRLIAGLIKPRSGSIEIPSNGEAASPRIGFVFQEATLLPWRTAAANIALPGELENVPVPRTRVEELAEFVGLSRQDLRKRPTALSGGMKMRVSLARALALQPDLLLLDEPFAALDDLLRQQLQNDVLRIHQELHLTTLLVTHNIPEAVYMSDRVVALGGTPAQIIGRTNIDLQRLEDERLSSRFSQLVRTVTGSLQAEPAKRSR